MGTQAVPSSQRGQDVLAWESFFAYPLVLPASICYERGSLVFRGSSVVEHPTVNRTVVGSNPTRGAIEISWLALRHLPRHLSSRLRVTGTIRELAMRGSAAHSFAARS